VSVVMAGRTRRIALLRYIVTLAFALTIGAARSLAQTPSATPVTQVRIEGNQRVEDDAIRVHIQSRPAEPLNALGQMTRALKCRNSRAPACGHASPE
jgi:cell division septal protein FtsQ